MRRGFDVVDSSRHPLSEIAIYTDVRKNVVLIVSGGEQNFARDSAQKSKRKFPLITTTEPLLPCCSLDVSVVKFICSLSCFHPFVYFSLTLCFSTRNCYYGDEVSFFYSNYAGFFPKRGGCTLFAGLAFFFFFSFTSTASFEPEICGDNEIETFNFHNKNDVDYTPSPRGEGGWGGGRRRGKLSAARRSSADETNVTKYLTPRADPSPRCRPRRGRARARSPRNRIYTAAARAHVAPRTRSVPSAA